MTFVGCIHSTDVQHRNDALDANDVNLLKPTYCVA